MTLHHAYIGDRGGNQIDAHGAPAWSDASRITIESGGPADASWRFSGDTLLKAVIEAPDVALVMRDEVILAGRVSVDQLRLRHGASILYDHGLDSGTSATGLVDSEEYDGQHRISRRLARRLTQLAERLSRFDHDFRSDSLAGAGAASRYQIAPDAAWSSSPSSRDVPVQLRLLMHGGDTQHWESLVASAEEETRR
jgi:hypothetical protein